MRMKRNGIKISGMKEQLRLLARKGKGFLQDERGIGVVEIILILVVLIGLILIFKEQLTDLVESIFEKITSESSGI